MDRTYKPCRTSVDTEASGSSTCPELSRCGEARRVRLRSEVVDAQESRATATTDAAGPRSGGS